MRKSMKRSSGLLAALLALALAGTASAYALGRIVWVTPGHCKKVHGSTVCARAARGRTVTQTVKQTTTVLPSSAGKNFSGTADEDTCVVSLPAFSLAHGSILSWSISPGPLGETEFSITGLGYEFVYGNGALSGSSYLDPGHYTGANRLVLGTCGPYSVSF